ncbi:Dual specificity protein kinase [Balamuthia mandrillaris]
MSAPIDAKEGEEHNTQHSHRWCNNGEKGGAVRDGLNGRGFHTLRAEDVTLVSLLSDSTNSFGDVWKATIHMKPVAVKIPRIGPNGLTQQELSNWITEMEVMSRNYHPNILLYMGTCVKNDNLMIVMELLDSDLHKLLHESKVALSLFERVKMCKDVALGMNWLHMTEPTIIHRDLKTSNLLVEKIDSRYKVKIADFGVALIKGKEAKISEQDSPFLGTILTTAPEILTGEGTYNEKTDVYSFGLILWEITTRQRLFPEFLQSGSLSAFIAAVCNSAYRPPIPNNCNSRLRVLIEQCWHSEPSLRPNFTYINEELDRILIESAIRDPHGKAFWTKHFLKKEYVSWEDFSVAFYDFLRVKLPQEDPYVSDCRTDVVPYIMLDTFDDPPQQHSQPQNEANSTVNTYSTQQANALTPAELLQDAKHRPYLLLRCLYRLLTDQAMMEGEPGLPLVSVVRFGQVLDWFGPIRYRRRGSPSCDLLDMIAEVLSQEWFHGDITAPAAQDALAGKPPGTFLVRFTTNDSFPGCFTITRLCSSGSPSHIRIMHTEKGFSVSEDLTFERLGGVVDCLWKRLNLGEPLCNSPYRSIFDTPIPSPSSSSSAASGKQNGRKTKQQQANDKNNDRNNEDNSKEGDTERRENGRRESNELRMASPRTSARKAETTATAAAEGQA